MQERSSRGAVFAEYALLLAFILIVCAVAVGTLGVEVAALYTWPVN